MKKSKLLAIFFALMMLFVFGCSGGNSEDNSSESQVSTESTTESNDSVSSEDNDSSNEETENSTDKYGLDIDTITIATSPGYEPFEFMEGDELVGYDIDIWNEFESRTGIEVKWEQADFSGLLGLLDTGRADVIAAQMGSSPEREKNYSFSDPISYFSAVVAVPEDSEVEDPTKDFVGKRLGVGAGNEQQNVLQSFYEEGQITWEIYNSGTLENMISDVDFGRIDGAVGQNIQLSMAIEEAGLPLKLTKPFKETAGTLVVKNENQELLEAINTFIAEIKEDGTLSEISEKWVGMDISESQS